MTSLLRNLVNWQNSLVIVISQYISNDDHNVTPLYFNLVTRHETSVKVTSQWSQWKVIMREMNYITFWFTIMTGTFVIIYVTVISHLLAVVLYLYSFEKSVIYITFL